MWEKLRLINQWLEKEVYIPLGQTTQMKTNNWTIFWALVVGYWFVLFIKCLNTPYCDIMNFQGLWN